MKIAPLDHIRIPREACWTRSRVSLATRRRAVQAGSVLVIVLWISFGLVSIALYFGHSMMVELRASENRSAAHQAEQAVAGASRYVRFLLANLEEPGLL